MLELIDYSTGSMSKLVGLEIRHHHANPVNSVTSAPSVARTASMFYLVRARSLGWTQTFSRRPTLEAIYQNTTETEVRCD